MGRDRAYDLEETMRNPLELTCCLSMAEVADCEDDPRPTRLLEKRRPERVFVTPVQQTPAKPKAREPWRPEPRARPTPPRGAPVTRRPVQAAPPMTQVRVLPRAHTIPTHIEPLFDLSQLVMFWGMALAGSLVAIGIALASW